MVEWKRVSPNLSFDSLRVLKLHEIESVWYITEPNLSFDSLRVLKQIVSEIEKALNKLNHPATRSEY